MLGRTARREDAGADKTHDQSDFEECQQVLNPTADTQAVDVQHR
jgi:hypothetical protein